MAEKKDREKQGERGGERERVNFKVKSELVGGGRQRDILTLTEIGSNRDLCVKHF